MTVSEAKAEPETDDASHEPIDSFAVKEGLTLPYVYHVLGEPDYLVKSESESEESELTVVGYGPFGARDASNADVTKYRLRMTFEFPTANRAMTSEAWGKSLINHHEAIKNEGWERNRFSHYGVHPTLRSWERNRPAPGNN